jgi:pimeloyl-ACP methyl ester carboxylesterase
MTDNRFTREDVDFVCRGLRCAAWLYRPVAPATDGRLPPLVVMAHGFGAWRNFGLPAFAERFVAAGMAVMLFDYRCFGDSEGSPKNWVSHRRHLQDWKAAVAHARSLQGVDAERLALWGSSFSGGHVVVTAAGDPDVRAVVAQVPLADGRAAMSSTPAAKGLKMLAAGLRDAGRMLSRRPAYTLPIVGEPGELAVLNAENCSDGYLDIVPAGSDWDNSCPARVVFTAAFYRPIKSAPRVACPTLLLAARHDELVPYESVEREARALPRGELVTLDCGHFDPYLGETFERTVAIETEFLARHLQA